MKHLYMLLAFLLSSCASVKQPCKGGWHLAYKTGSICPMCGHPVTRMKIVNWEEIK